MRFRSSWSTIAIYLIAPVAALAVCPPDCPFTLVDSHGCDANGIALNPQWQGQSAQQPKLDTERLCRGFPSESPKGRLPCIGDDVYVDAPEGLHKFICQLTSGDSIKGHINWRQPATFAGKVVKSEIAFDRDYTWDIGTVDGRILTTDRPTLHVEAHGTETVDKFSSPWWGQLRNSLFPGRERLTNGKQMVITGLLNLDSEHGAYSELHPIYALAVRTADTEFNGTTGLFHDHWAFFARNWGNQGFCSKDQHHLTGLPAALCGGDPAAQPCFRFTVHLPLGKSEEVILDKSRTDVRVSKGVGGPVFSRDEQGLSVTFALLAPEQRSVAYGEVAFHWRADADAAAPPLVGAAPAEIPATTEFESTLELLREEASPEAKEALDDLVLGVVPNEVKVDLTGVPAVVPLVVRAPCGAVTPRVGRAGGITDTTEDAKHLAALCSGSRSVAKRADFEALATRQGFSRASIKAVLDECEDRGFLSPDEPGDGGNE